MKLRLNCSSSLHSMALRPRHVPFVLPSGHGNHNKTGRHTATTELFQGMSQRSGTMDLILGDTRHPAAMASLESSPAVRYKHSPRRCNSEPHTRLSVMSIDVPQPLSSTSTSRRPKPQRCNSEPNGYGSHRACQQQMTENGPPGESPPGSLRNNSVRRRYSELCRNPAGLQCCEVLRVYEEAVCFQERLRKSYETCKRVFILFRYRRLRTLIREATMEQRLSDLRQGIRCQCSCGRHGDGAKSRVDNGHIYDGMLEELLDNLRPALRRIRSYLQSTFSVVVPSLLMSSTPSLHDVSTSSSEAFRLDEHEWQRSRILLLERHLERLKRECVSSHSSALPLRRYKAMKNSLKHVLDARMV